MYIVILIKNFFLDHLCGLLLLLIGLFVHRMRSDEVAVTTGSTVTLDCNTETVTIPVDNCATTSILNTETSTDYNTVTEVTSLATTATLITSVTVCVDESVSVSVIDCVTVILDEDSSTNDVKRQIIIAVACVLCVTIIVIAVIIGICVHRKHKVQHFNQSPNV